MSELGFLLLIVLVSLLAAWLVNLLLSLMRGEHSKDTGRVWWDMVKPDLLEEFFEYIAGSWIRIALAMIGFVIGLIVLVKSILGD